MKRLVLATLAAIAMLIVTMPSVAAQEGEGSELQSVIVHRVDATSSSTELMALADSYEVDQGAVSISENGSDLTVSRVTTARRSGLAQEIVFVIDSSQGLAKGDVFETAKSQIIDAISGLPSGTSVAVLGAGDTATIRVAMTSDLGAAAKAVANMKLSNGSVLFNAVDRASGEFSQGDALVARTLVVFSGSEDSRSGASPAQARSGLVQGGIQVVTVAYKGGATGLGQLIDGTGGFSLSADSNEDLVAALSQATTIASDRLLVSFAGTADPTVRGDAVLTVGDASVGFSYAGGSLTNSTVRLRPVEVTSPGGIAFFRTTTGLYVALGLVFASVVLAVFSLGSIFASGETALEGLLSRYAGGGDGDTLDDEESAIVQTALVKKAVELSESFAEDRGFLVRIEGMLERAQLPLRAGEAMAAYAAGIVLGAMFGFVLIGGLIGALILAGTMAIGMLFFVSFKAKRRKRKFEKQLPDTLQLLAGTLRAGYSLPQGLEAVSHESADPMGIELRRVMTEARLGRDLLESLGATAERLESPDFAWAVMAIGIQREVGGNLNELLMTVSDTMIARERLKGEVATLTAEGKMSAILLGGLPPALGVVMWVMNPDYINQLFITTLGKIFLGAAVVTSLIGFAWMKKVITINV